MSLISNFINCLKLFIVLYQFDTCLIWNIFLYVKYSGVWLVKHLSSRTQCLIKYEKNVSCLPVVYSNVFIHTFLECANLKATDVCRISDNSCAQHVCCKKFTLKILLEMKRKMKYDCNFWWCQRHCHLYCLFRFCKLVPMVLYFLLF
jgi:hypothetical protein